MTFVNNQTIEGQDVRLDDHTFISRNLVDCRIFYAGGHFGLDDTNVTNPSWVFDGAAQRTIELLLTFDLSLSGMHVSRQSESLPN